MRLANKVAIVTGGGSGIGREIALTFAAEGANLAVADVNLQQAEQLAGEIESMGRQAIAVKTDVSNVRQIDEMVTRVLQTFKGIDILVNNAGTVSTKPVLEVTEDDWFRLLNVNLKGVFFCSQTVGNVMIKQGRGKIINIASAAGHRGIPGQAVYGVTKAGIIQLTRVLAVEWAEYHVNVNSISPGTVLTPLLERAAVNVENRIKGTPTGRINRPRDVAAAALFLASEDSDNITGQDIFVDGGVSALYWPKGQG